MLLRPICQTMILIVAASSIASAEDKPGSRENTPLRKLINESIGWLELRKADEETPMKPQVIMRWPNSSRGSADGATVIWTHLGRPEAVAAIYPWEGKAFVQEFDSMSRGKIVATRDDEIVWAPSDGLVFRGVDDWPEPAGARALRVRQMKSLAKQFSATLLGWKVDDSQREELRLAPAPLYRYEVKKRKGLIDGALFAFVTGTDPEVILMLEAVRVQDKPTWQYAFVRRSSGRLQARHRKELVWEAARFPGKNDPQSKHVEFGQPLDEVLPVTDRAESE